MALTLRERHAVRFERSALLHRSRRSLNVAVMKTIDLFLWRHAEAEDTTPDLARTLTPRGQRDAARVAKVLAKQVDTNTRVIASPAVRTRETAAPLIARSALELEIDDRLAPGADVGVVLGVLDAAMAAAAGETASLVLVGHQPWVGQVARRLLADGDGDWSVKKASAWWLVRRSRGGSTEWTLRSVLDPDLV